MNYRLALICTLGLSASLAFAAPSWRRYANDRFAVSADVPGDWREQPAPANDDGRTFLSPGGEATLLVYGGFVTEDSPAQALDALARPRDGERMTLTQRGAHSVTVSGFSGGGIFYRRTILTCADQVENSVEFDYPIAEKAALDPIVVHVAASLRGGAPAGMKCPN